MTITDGDISGVKNKIVRGQLLLRQKKEKAQNKLRKRIERKEAENRGETVERGQFFIPSTLREANTLEIGWTRTIENTKEWLGDSETFSDPRTRPAKVEVDSETGDVKVDLGSLSTLFPPSLLPPHDPNSNSPPPLEAKILITTSPGKPPSLYSKDFLDDLQAFLGGKGRADIVPRRSPKFELGKVARWARGRGYGAIAVVGEDHAKPSTSLASPFHDSIDEMYSYVNAIVITQWTDRSFQINRNRSLPKYKSTSPSLPLTPQHDTNRALHDRATPSQLPIPPN